MHVELTKGKQEGHVSRHNVSADLQDGAPARQQREGGGRGVRTSLACVATATRSIRGHQLMADTSPRACLVPRCINAGVSVSKPSSAMACCCAPGRGRSAVPG